ncbi:MAG: RHS repeat-associated core domain-containing protein, partial [Bryobacteraceae bacterium]
TAIAGFTNTFDAENRLLTSTLGGVTTTYTYDGDGRRVQKATGGSTTTYVYDAAGQLAAEYSTAPPAPPCTTCYLTQDHLGSTRMMTDASGALKSLHDYVPFGEEIQAGVGGRSSTYYPPSPLAINDTVAQKFTGKERDVETGLDHFDARYYSAAQGRWTIPDWSARQDPVPYARIDDPQTLNLYGYMRNNPLGGADADGHCGGPNDPPCSNVKVEAKVDQKPAVVQNQTIKDVNGKVVAKATGVEGKLVDTVKVDGKPTAGVKVTETNQTVDTKNGQPVSSNTVQGKGSTNADGQIADNIGVYHPTDGTKAGNNLIKQDFRNNTWAVTDKQTLTLTLPSGQACSANSTRTLTNAGTDGPSSQYTLTTTQPVVTPAN